MLHAMMQARYDIIIRELGSSVGRGHNWDAGDCWFESHEIQPGDFSTAMQTD